MSVQVMSETSALTGTKYTFSLCIGSGHGRWNKGPADAAREPICRLCRWYMSKNSNSVPEGLHSFRGFCSHQRVLQYNRSLEGRETTPSYCVSVRYLSLGTSHLGRSHAKLIREPLLSSTSPPPKKATISNYQKVLFLRRKKKRRRRRKRRKQGPKIIAKMGSNGDIVYPLHMLDDTKGCRDYFVALTFRFNDVLDAEKLGASLSRLLEIGDWKKLGGRLQLNVRELSRTTR